MHLALLLTACSVIAPVLCLSRIGVSDSANYSPYGTRLAFNSDFGGIPQVWTVAGPDEPPPFDAATLRSTPGPAETAGGQRFRRDCRLFATHDTLAREDGPTAAEAAVIEVPRRELHEFTLRGRTHVAIPFRDAALVGEFTSAAGKTIVVDGFFDGDDTWRLRFTPDEEGEWRYRLRGEGVALSQVGRLRCMPSKRKGFVRVHRDNPYAFAYADGTPFFPMGDTCYGLLDDSPITPELRAEYLRTRRSQRFNFVRMSVGHSEAREGRRSRRRSDVARHDANAEEDAPGRDHRLCSNSMRSNRASLPIAVGAMPVSVKSPKSFQRSRVTTVHSRGAEGEISTDCQPVVFRPAW
jgi:hypothetical protein